MNIVWAFNLTSDTKMTLGLENYIVVRGLFLFDIECQADHYFVLLNIQPGLELAPKPFVCKAIVRDAEREKLVRSVYMASRKD